ncbi:MAG: peptidase dipeptidase [Solirubrobacterales bacterium]|nr:peptidase dipeptidase [Solirubrobacterales bacterium]
MDGRIPTIFAMGGGGFTMEPENPALDEFILSLATGRQVPRILLLPTASGDAGSQEAQFRATFADRPCEPSVLSLFRLGEHGPIDLRQTILDQDIVYVGGGSLRNLLAIWRVHEMDDILREAWAAGVVLAGLSAGAMCWFAGGVTKSSGEPEIAKGLGLLPGSLSVHADGDPDRLPVYERAVASRQLPAGWAADDGVGLLFQGRDLVRVVSSRPGRRAVWIEQTPSGLRHDVRVPELLASVGSVTDQGSRIVSADVLEFRRARRHGASLRD